MLDKWPSTNNRGQDDRRRTTTCWREKSARRDPEPPGGNSVPTCPPCARPGLVLQRPGGHFNYLADNCMLGDSPNFDRQRSELVERAGEYLCARLLVNGQAFAGQ